MTQVGKVMRRVILAIVAMVLWAIIIAGIISYAAGLVHHDWRPMPPLGFKASFGAMILLEAIGTALRGHRQ